MSTQQADQPLSALTVAEIQALIRETVEEVLQEMLGDSDAGLAAYVRSKAEPLALKEARATLARVEEGSGMGTITIEVPEPLAQQIAAQRVSLDELQAIFQASVELWLVERDRQQADLGKDARLFQDSAIPFARRLIAQNRELFEELARR